MKLAMVWLAVGIADLWWINAALVPGALADARAQQAGEAGPPVLAAVAGTRPDGTREPRVQAEQSRAQPGEQEDIAQRSKLEEYNVRAGTVEEDNVRADTVNVSAVEESAREESAREESAREESAREESAREESAVEESAVEESALEESALEDSARAREADDATATPPPRPPILFASGEAEVSGDDARAVQQLAAYLVAHVDVVVALEGHTDRRGSAAANLRLARARADHIRARLVEGGVADARIEVRAVGDRHPRRRGRGRDALAANRRVEIHLSRPEAHR